jgi:hypothetical protein
LQVLKRSVAIEKEKEFALDNRSAQSPSVLGALEGLRESPWSWQGCRQRAIAEEVKSLTMNGI